MTLAKLKKIRAALNAAQTGLASVQGEWENQLIAKAPFDKSALLEVVELAELALRMKEMIFKGTFANAMAVYCYRAAERLMREAQSQSPAPRAAETR